MAIFSFNLFDGAATFQGVETELPDRETAHAEAIRFAGEMLRDRSRQISPGQEWCLEVADHEGEVIFVIDLKFSEPSYSSEAVKSV